MFYFMILQRISYGNCTVSELSDCGEIDMEDIDDSWDYPASEAHLVKDWANQAKVGQYRWFGEYQLYMVRTN
jgi:hypothetical protein